MNIISRNLYQGDLQDALTVASGKSPNIDRVLFLGLNLPPYLVDTEKPVIHIPIRDEATTSNDEKMLTALDIIGIFVENDISVIVSCDGGLSRSAILCLIFLVVSQGLKWEDAEKLINRLIPQFQPSQGLLNQMKKLLRNIQEEKMDRMIV